MKKFPFSQALKNRNGGASRGGRPTFTLSLASGSSVKVKSHVSLSSSKVNSKRSKTFVGQRQELGRSQRGEFSGETPIFMGTASIVSVPAVTKCRVARFERQQLQELVRGAGLTQAMSQYLVQQIHDKANIRVESHTQVIGAHGEDHPEQITTTARPPGGPEFTCTRDAKALFIMIGAVAKTHWLPTSLERDANGYICTGRDITTWSLEREPFALETSIPGIFCAGDVRHGSAKRASGVGEGSVSIAFIHEYLVLAGTHPQGNA